MLTNEELSEIRVRAAEFAHIEETQGFAPWENKQAEHDRAALLAEVERLATANATLYAAFNDKLQQAVDVQVTPVDVPDSLKIWKRYNDTVMLRHGFYYWIYNTAAGIVQEGKYCGPGTDNEALWLTDVGTIYNRYVSHYCENIGKPEKPGAND